MIDRRSFLRSAGASLALPALPSLARDKGSPAPPVAVWLYFPNGTPPGSWLPKCDSKGAIRSLNPAMAPLQGLESQLLFPRGLHTPRGNGHGAGTATWLTGGEWDDRALSPGGSSVDWIAARALGEERVAPCLSLGTSGEGFFATDLPRNHISWSSANRPSFRETDPRALFLRLFGAGPQADRSLLDGLRSQAKVLAKSLGAADRRKLEEYLEAVRGIERRIAFASGGATAKLLDQAKTQGWFQPPAAIPEQHGDYLDLLLDLVALALWTGATRLATVMLDHGQSNRYCPFIPKVQGTWHALSHWRDASGETEDDDGVTQWSSTRSKRDMYSAVVTWHHGRVARFLRRLQSLPYGEGSLLDASVVTYGSSLADGHDHGDRDLPILVAGGGAGALRGGRVLAEQDAISLSSVHLATLRALGVEHDSFAEADRPLAWG